VSAPPATKRVRVLFVEDSDDDVALELAALRQSGLEPIHEVVEDPDELRTALARERWDVVLSDYSMPSFTGLDAMRIVRQLDPDLPFILVSGTVGEDFAVDAMRAGAHDYVLKGNLTRLAASIERELRDAELRRDRRRIEQDRRFWSEVHGFLAEAGKVLGRTLDVGSTLEEATRLAVPWLADHAFGLIAEGDVGHVRATVQAHAGALQDLPGTLAEAAPVRSALQDGRSILIAEVSDGAPESAGEDVGGRAALRAAGLCSAMIVPLRGRSGVTAALLFATSRSGRRYTERDLLVAEELAIRAGLALKNARLYRQAQEAIRVRDEFLAMLGHELRNPLAPIVTAVQLLKMREGSAPRREHEVIERQAQHLVRLVDDLLDVSRITQGKVTLRTERIELAAVIAKAVETASPLIDQRRHYLSVDVPSSGLLVLADEARLVQVVSNLLTNAARYTEPGGQIRVHAARAGTEVVLSVSDTGIGIQPELLSKLFEAFVQGKRTIDRHEGGLGLGLALARSLTKLHGGTIEARSDGPGRGSEFVVRLPALEATAATTVDARPAHAAPPAARGARRVLVVDDNKDAAMMLAEVLASQGFVVRVAIDPLQALEYMESFVADIAVLDIGLPVIDGHELARRLRERYGPSLRLVALTGYGQQADKEKACEVGFDVHLVKPVDVSHLVQAILP